MVNYVDVEQRSPAWFDERLGSLGASQIYDATARLKSGKGFTAKREDVMTKLLLERVCGVSGDKATGAALRHGIEQESPARLRAEFELDVSIREVGLFRHNRIAKTHASPDGVRADKPIGVEIKAPTSATHYEVLMTSAIPENYVPQVHWQMACGGFEAVHWVSFDPRFPTEAQFFCKTVERDDKAISELEELVEEFLHELAKREQAFRERFLNKEAAERAVA